MVHANIRGAPREGRQMNGVWSTTAIFSAFGRYMFTNFRRKKAVLSQGNHAMP